MCIYIYIYTYIHAYIYIYIYVHIYVCICMFVCVYIYIYIYIYMLSERALRAASVTATWIARNANIKPAVVFILVRENGTICLFFG